MPQVHRSVIDEDEVDTVLDNSIVFEGTIRTSKSLLIKGNVRGVIECADDLFIAPEATVDAEIHTVRLTVRGTLSGQAFASESIEILAGSRVKAFLESPDIDIEDKEEFQGTATVTGQPGEL